MAVGVAVADRRIRHFAEDDVEVLVRVLQLPPVGGGLQRPVKIMAGGITGWLDEGFALESGAAPSTA